LTVGDGRILRASDGGDTGLSIGDIARMSVPGAAPFGDGGALEAEFVYSRPDSMTFSFIAQIVHVALDPRTGFFRLLDVYVIHDAGRALDPVLVDGQIIGGTVDGIGGALLSELLYSDDGQLLTGSLSDYLVATATEVPRIRTDHHNTPARTNPLGVRGVGEGGIIPTAPAIVNALARIVSPDDLTAADGLFRTPVKSETVRRAIVMSRQRASR
jgi:CO/xanthine dehydrogenase Mo-binding subunit